MINKIVFLSTLLFVLLAHVAYADFIGEEWKYIKDIEVPSGIGEHTLVGIELDSEVFGTAKSSFADLRIVSEEGFEVPYVLRSERGRRAVEKYSPEVFDLSFVDDSHTSFIVDFGESIAHNEIIINTPSRNFRKTVTLEGSNDRDSWQTLTEEVEIYDYSLEFTARDTSVSYPESLFRYVRVTIDDSEGERIDVDGALAKRVELTRAQKVSYDPTVGVTEDIKENQTIITSDIGQRGIETDTAHFSISSENFERYVVIYASHDDKHYQRIGSDVIYSYNTSKKNTLKTTVRHSPTNKRYLRFVINNYDNQPLDIASDVRLEGLAHSVLFLADPDTQYDLYYGYERGFTPRYDFESVYQQFDEDEVVRGSLGPQRISEQYVPPAPEPEEEDEVPWTDAYPWILPTMYLCAGGLLVFFMMSIYRKTSPTSHGKQNETDITNNR